jgi:SAM-dependent methyltransferase
MKTLIASIKARLRPPREFSSQGYWAERYRAGGNSGPGSYGRLARFKADVLNEFVKSNGVASVIEFGSGDGNQLALAQYSAYVGYDVSPVAVKACRERFAGDATKEFFLAEDYDGRQADLALSLDVIFHLTEDEAFDAYMRTLFAASRKHVILYSSNSAQPGPGSLHVRHRCFTRWIDETLPSAWSLVRTIPNAYPYDGDYETTSFSEFFIYSKR